MTRNEFIQRTHYVPKEDENFNFWEMHEDYVKSDMDKDEYCQKWLEEYNFFGSAAGIHNEITENINMPQCPTNPYEEWVNTPDSVLCAQGVPTHDCVEYGEKLKALVEGRTI